MVQASLGATIAASIERFLGTVVGAAGARRRPMFIPSIPTGAA
ncbi:hypothetical protein [Caulobacter sp. B11]|nr:hypothetical protein [Caulobacter sp. B11]